MCRHVSNLSQLLTQIKQTMESIDNVTVLLTQADSREDGTYPLTEPSTPEQEAASICRLSERLGRPVPRRVLAGLELIEQQVRRVAPSLLREVGYDLTLAIRYINTKLPQGYHVQKVEEGYLLINQAKRDMYYSELEIA